MPQFKSKTAHIAFALLQGEVITIMDGFKRFLVTNVPREVGRAIERKFDVKLSRTRKDFISTTGQPGMYFEYRLNQTEYNKAGVQRMWTYVNEKLIKPKSNIEPKMYTEQKLF
jgi:hypothetical protein